MPLYEVAIVRKMTKKESEDGGTEKLVMPPVFIMAKDPQTAAMSAVMGDKAPKGLDLNRDEVLVRPFS